MEAERAGPPIPVREVDELTLVIETIEGCRKEEIIPAMIEYLRESVGPACLIITKRWSNLVDGARTVFGLAVVMLFLIVIKVIHIIETGLITIRNQDMPTDVNEVYAGRVKDQGLTSEDERDTVGARGPLEEHECCSAVVQASISGREYLSQAGSRSVLSQVEQQKDKEDDEDEYKVRE